MCRRWCCLRFHREARHRSLRNFGAYTRPTCSLFTLRLRSCPHRRKTRFRRGGQPSPAGHFIPGVSNKVSAHCILLDQAWPVAPMACAPSTERPRVCEHADGAPRHHLCADGAHDGVARFSGRRSGPSSSPWSRQPRRPRRTSSRHPRCHRPRRWRAVVRASQRSDRRGWRSI